MLTGINSLSIHSSHSRIPTNTTLLSPNHKQKNIFCVNNCHRYPPRIHHFAHFENESSTPLYSSLPYHIHAATMESKRMQQRSPALPLHRILARRHLSFLHFFNFPSPPSDWSHTLEVSPIHVSLSCENKLLIFSVLIPPFSQRRENGEGS